MNVLALTIGIVLIFWLLDRLRVIGWKTTKPEYVSLYLAQTLWAIGIVLDSLKGGIEFYQFGALVATAIWLALTRKNWRDGPPEHVQTEPAPLGEPELGSRL